MGVPLCLSGPNTYMPMLDMSLVVCTIDCIVIGHVHNLNLQVEHAVALLVDI